jgi:hypothetical protein
MIATVTHARVRAEQGDLAGAIRVLHGVLAATPGDEAAASLRRRLVARHAAGKLRSWIERVRERRGAA